MTRTDREPYEPTPVDRLFGQSYVRTQLAFHLDHSSECATLLRKGMERLILTLPFLSRELVIHVTGGRIESITTKSLSSRDLDQMLKIKHHSKPLRQAVAEANNDRARLDEEFMPIPVNFSDVSHPCPVIVVQANIHPDGVLLAVATNHMVMDAAGQGIAVQYLADCCRLEEGEMVTLPTCSAEQDRGRQMLMHELPAKVVNREFPEYRLSKNLYLESAAMADMVHKAAATIRVAHFIIADEDVHVLKTRCNEMLPQLLEIDGHLPGAGAFTGHTPWVSSSDVIIALIWCSINRVRYPALTEASKFSPTRSKWNEEGDSGEVVCVGVPVNIRDRVSPALPTSYMGNGAILMLVSQALQIFASADWMSTLCRVALAIRTKLAAVNSDDIRSLLSYIQNAEYPVVFSFDVANYFVSNWRQMGFYNANFGSKMGKPQYIRNPDAIVEGTVFIMPKRSQPENAPWELQISLKDETLQQLAKDNVWATYLHPDTYWL